MNKLHLDPRNPAFVQNPYTAYAQARRDGPVLFWEDYGMYAAFDGANVQALLRDRRLGREIPVEQRPAPQPHLAAFDAIETHSMLELEPPRHTRLRGLVLRAFTSRRIGALRPDIEAVSRDLIAGLPQGDFDLIPAYCTQLPVRIIARLLGVPETMAPDLLAWSNAMVAMYQANRDRQIEDAANAAAAEFTAFLRDYIEQRRTDPRDDLITQLIAAEEDGSKLSNDEMIGTCVLLLNAGHEATVHSLGNSVKCLLEHDTPRDMLAPERVNATVEELLRYDPPLHLFTRYAYADIELGAVTLKKGEQIALILGAAGRDPALHTAPDDFDPARPAKPHAAFGGGLHFCVGAPLARLELQTALPMLFDALPQMRLAEEPCYADTFHFHRLERLMVTR
ncbi:cytochrome P450 [Sulfitobacter aestuarii]|uniref:Cytochrome P450 n=1 Tax=Sulfitobacter aestuarii TaxID=2161676 RepID=A0ABW5U3E9_9RHOB